MTLLFFAAVVVGMVSSSAQAAGERGPFGFQPSLFLKISGVAEILAFPVLIVWGFSRLAWYVPISALGLGFVIQYSIDDSRVGVFYKAAPFLNVAVIAATIYLWGA